MNMSWSLASLCIFSFLLGSIPFALVISKAKGVDIRKEGSGNLGATNIYRVFGFKVALAVFICDAAKGFAPTALTMLNFYQPSYHLLVGAFAILGHMVSPFARFKGGKGVATGLGMLLAISPDVTLIVFTTAAILIYKFRYVAPVSIIGSMLAPLLLFLFDYPQEYILFVTMIALLIVLRHRKNIGRIFSGNENKV